MPKLTRSQWTWLGVLAVALALAQVNQPYPEIAPLQHAPTLVLLLAAPWLLKRWPLSDGALGCIMVFFLLHTLGGRYTDSNLPYEDWYHTLTGGDFATLTGWHRNHYDRLVHFAFGVLSVRPVTEIARLNGLRTRGGLWAAFGFVLSVSCLYEIFEWLLTMTIAGDMADDYNGQQGDMWDAQKDMALAALGALTGIALSISRNRK
jgi:putative membrane protein